MASSLLRSDLNLPSVSSHSSTNLTPKTNRSYIPVRCGPRSKRGPLMKGRILSTEAIQAIQALKRAQKADSSQLDIHISKTISRLIKSDLVATFNELVRQDCCDLALKVFLALRKEYGSPDLDLHANLVKALARNGFREEIDRLILEMEMEDSIECEDAGLVTLVKALIAAERAESTARLYKLMRKRGWGSRITADEYLGKVLSRGLRRLGEVKIADEIDTELGRFSRGNSEKTLV